eukprot:TRINITY_DN3197_c0_g1_i1.p1 TRINITY_DN3197_c0_g1~~TRINITY_DN3197_c0_g1_i1.p1  ORF type:complete len:1320 (-),score=346.70 TRINITY_DN3197_c0_g1_i1:38-3997(-)
MAHSLSSDEAASTSSTPWAAQQPSDYVIGRERSGSQIKFRPPRQLDDNNPYKGPATSTTTTTPPGVGVPTSSTSRTSANAQCGIGNSGSGTSSGNSMSAEALSTAPAITASGRKRHSRSNSNNVSSGSPTFGFDSPKKLISNNNAKAPGSGFKKNKSPTSPQTGILASLRADASPTSSFISDTDPLMSIAEGHPEGLPAENPRKLRNLGERSRNFSQLLRDMLREDEKEGALHDSSDPYGGARSDSDSESAVRRGRLTLKPSKKKPKKDKDISSNIKDNKDKEKNKEKAKDKEKRRNVFTSSSRLITSSKARDEKQATMAGANSGNTANTYSTGVTVDPLRLDKGPASPQYVNGARTLDLSGIKGQGPGASVGPVLRDSTNPEITSPRNRHFSSPAPAVNAILPPLSPRNDNTNNTRHDSPREPAKTALPDDRDPLIIYKTTLIDRANQLAVQVTSLQTRLFTSIDDSSTQLSAESVKAANVALANLKQTMSLINNPPAVYLDDTKKKHQEKQGLVLNAVLECGSALRSLIKAGAMTYSPETNTTSIPPGNVARDEEEIANNCRRFASSIRYLISSVDGLPEPKKKKKPKKKRNTIRKRGESDKTRVLNSIQLADLQFDKKLGQGAFGDVFKGMWRQTTVVAIKQLHGDLMEEHHRKTFLDESSLMMSLQRHPNIVGCLGVCVDGDDCYLVLEFIPSGCLQTHLQIVDRATFKSADFLQLAQGIAAGMDHLEANHIVHRDLALRNILLEIRSDGQHIAKVSDFGMARLQMDVIEEGDEKGGSRFSIIGGNKIPIKWTSPEALLSKKYSSKSDVWSFGVTLWEIYSFGDTPYENIQNQAIIERIIGGTNLPKPAACPDDVYELMLQCWNMDPAKRPSFKEIFLRLRELEYEEKKIKRREIQQLRALQSNQHKNSECTNKSDADTGTSSDSDDQRGPTSNFDSMSEYGEVTVGDGEGKDGDGDESKWGRDGLDGNDFGGVDDGMGEYGEVVIAAEVLKAAKQRNNIITTTTTKTISTITTQKQHNSTNVQRTALPKKGQGKKSSSSGGGASSNYSSWGTDVVDDGMGEYGEVVLPASVVSSTTTPTRTPLPSNGEDSSAAIRRKKSGGGGNKKATNTNSSSNTKTKKGRTKGSFIKKEREGRERGNDLTESASTAPVRSRPGSESPPENHSRERRSSSDNLYDIINNNNNNSNNTTTPPQPTTTDGDEESGDADGTRATAPKKQIRRPESAAPVPAPAPSSLDIAGGDIQRGKPGAKRKKKEGTKDSSSSSVELTRSSSSSNGGGGGGGGGGGSDKPQHHHHHRVREMMPIPEDVEPSGTL